MTLPQSFWDTQAVGGTISSTELDQYLLAEGRNGGPAVLWVAWEGEMISYDTLAAHVGAVWSLAEFPDQCLEREQWLELFRCASFTVDGKRAALPTEPLTLWRGAVPERRADWSWTTDPEVARTYASGTMLGRPMGKVWQVVAPPGALLAANLGPDTRKESEYVVDTRGLNIFEDEEYN